MFMQWGLWILQLRELVPPQNMGNGTSEGGDAKRAKHVVLSDTIALLKKMQAQLPRQMKVTCPHGCIS